MRIMNEVKREKVEGYLLTYMSVGTDAKNVREEREKRENSHVELTSESFVAWAQVYSEESRTRARTRANSWMSLRAIYRKSTRSKSQMSYGRHSIMSLIACPESLRRVRNPSSREIPSI